MSYYPLSFAPRFFLEIDGRDATDLMPFISKFDYQDHENKTDELTLTISNKGIRWQDDFRIGKGIPIKTRWGYPNNMSVVKELTIVQIEASFPNDVPSIQIKAHDKKKGMAKRLKSGEKSKPKAWGYMNSSDIAREIAKRHGLKFEGENSNDARKEYRIQPSAFDDMAMVYGLAHILHWDCYVEGNTLHFHSKRLGAAPLFEYVYYSDRSGSLLDFSSELDLRKIPKTGKAGANPTDGKPSASEADAKSTDAPYSGSYAEIDVALGSIASVHMPTPESNPSVVNKQAKAVHAAIELSATKASMTVIGTPKLQSKMMVSISGVGRAYSGNWRVKECTHSIQPSGSIYTTRCDLVRNAAMIGKKENKVPGDTKGKTDAGATPPTVVIDVATGSIERR